VTTHPTTHRPDGGAAARSQSGLSGRIARVGRSPLLRRFAVWGGRFDHPSDHPSGARVIAVALKEVAPTDRELRALA